MHSPPQAFLGHGETDATGRTSDHRHTAPELTQVHTPEPRILGHEWKAIEPRPATCVAGRWRSWRHFARGHISGNLQWWRHGLGHHCLNTSLHHRIGADRQATLLGVVSVNDTVETPLLHRPKELGSTVICRHALCIEVGQPPNCGSLAPIRESHHRHTFVSGNFEAGSDDIRGHHSRTECCKCYFCVQCLETRLYNLQFVVHCFRNPQRCKLGRPIRTPHARHNRETRRRYLHHSPLGLLCHHRYERPEGVHHPQGIHLVSELPRFRRSHQHATAVQHHTRIGTQELYGHSWQGLHGRSQQVFDTFQLSDVTHKPLHLTVTLESETIHGSLEWFRPLVAQDHVHPKRRASLRQSVTDTACRSSDDRNSSSKHRKIHRFEGIRSRPIKRCHRPQCDVSLRAACTMNETADPRKMWQSPRQCTH
mmetsp:Transcript_43435/g.114488  ORF Transcript_43435/g.114488 Transcript_43435/m.114488 type:complete len:423 (+) Transcript_43435:868-2136(+)